MDLPQWVREIIGRFTAPVTGKVVIELEVYSNGITKMSIGGIVRETPPGRKEAV